MRLSYVLPLIGPIEIELYDFAENLYKILKSKGEIQRLQSLAHLGVLQDLFPGIKHSRWDYTIVNLYLIDLLRLEGLSSAKKVGSLRLSGKDMLQTMALIANIGHIPGTFAVEKGIMRAIYQDSTIYDKIIEGSSFKKSQLTKSQLNYIFINKLLACLKLQDWIQNANDDENKQILQAVHILAKDLFLNTSDKEHRKIILSYFNQIRRMSYQYLDSIYVDLPIVIDLPKFISNFGKNKQQQAQYFEYINNLLPEYERILYAKIYHSKEAREIVMKYSRATEQWMLNNEDRMNAIRDLISAAEIPQEIQEIKQEIEENLNYHKIFTIYIRTQFESNLLIDSFIEKGIDEFEYEASKVIQGIDPEAQVCIFYVPGLKESITGELTSGDILLDIWLNDSKKKLKALSILLVFFYLNFCQKMNTIFGIGFIWEAIFKAIIEDVLQGYTVKIETFPDEFFLDDFLLINEKDKFMVFSSRRDLEEVLSAFRKKTDPSWPKDKKRKFNELKSLQRLLRKTFKPKKGIRALHLVVPGDVEFRDKNTKKSIAEFDGAQLKIIMRGNDLIKVELHLIEAKSGYDKTAKSVKNSVKKKAQNLGLPMYKVLTIRSSNVYVRSILFSKK